MRGILLVVSAFLHSATAKIASHTKLRSPRNLFEDEPIPKNIWFMYENNLLETQKPVNHFNNVLKTVNAYQKEWNNDPHVTVNFVTDVDCAREISIAEPRLLPYFQNEEAGPYRSDICRAALLYLYGGYYFDVELEVVTPYLPAAGVSFASVNSCGGECFFGSFIAAVPKHPIIEQSLGQLLEVYENNLGTTMVGPIPLARAYLNLPPDTRGTVHLLSEVELAPEVYPEVERQDGWGRCNVAVHDADAHVVYFFARFVGSGGGCYPIEQKNSAHGDSALPRIDQRMWFTYKNDFTKSHGEDGVYENVMNTATIYRDAWGRGTAMNVVSDESCVRYIARVEPRLLKYFRSEKHGELRGDMCKLAVLYLYGGYYFDVDVKAVEAYKPQPTKSFVSVQVRSGGDRIFFPSFIASEKKHPILKKALEEMVLVYESSWDTKLLGPKALMKAFYELTDEEKEHVTTLEEINLEGTDLYPEIERQRGVGNCNYVVHDSTKSTVHFFSRYVGYPGCEKQAGSISLDHLE